MNVLLINKFLYPKGGAEISTINTAKLLVEKGHNVYFWGMKHFLNPAYPYSDYFIENIDYNRTLSIKDKLSASLKILYSIEARRKIEKLVNVIKPDIVHLNNFAHHISPSILHVFKKYNIPTVMTMRDYKLVCPAYSMFVNGKPCERCKNGRYYYCFLNKCIKNSYAKSLVATLEMNLHHKVLHIYDIIDVYISPSIFLKEKVKKMGLKKEVVYLPNFIRLDEFIPDDNYGNELCYFGRLSDEKGLDTLIEALKGVDITLKIIGTGPLEMNLKMKVEEERIRNVSFLGYKTGHELRNEVKKSMAVVIPSEWYENNPRIVLEAFALGKPVIGAKIGGIPELVKDGITGLTFKQGDSEDLKNKIGYLLKNQDLVIKMGKNARKFVEEKFNPEIHYEKLMKIYSRVIKKNERII